LLTMSRLVRTTAAAAATTTLAFALILTAAAPAGAITYGEPDGNRHPAVGALVQPTPYSDGTYAACSGTLISPTVFLTAAHCDLGTATVRVSFASQYTAKSTFYTGTFHADPLYNQSQSDPHDIAVVVFDAPVKGITPMRLPAQGSLANLPANQQFTSVGYGSYAPANGPGGKTYSYDDVRQVSTGTLNSINAAWLRISQNPATGNGGTCYGDSGGPNFLGAGANETNIIAATTITGDSACRSTNVDYRLDTPAARAFLGQYVTLP
jgi:V8-like Glu-specific endopeptidase